MTVKRPEKRPQAKIITNLRSILQDIKLIFPFIKDTSKYIMINVNIGIFMCGGIFSL